MKMPEEDKTCPECDSEDVVLRGEAESTLDIYEIVVICLNCGHTDHDRNWTPMREDLACHENRIKRMKALADALEDMNKNITTDEDLERKERILQILRYEMELYHRWIGEKADREAMSQENSRIRSRRNKTFGSGHT